MNIRLNDDLYQRRKEEIERQNKATSRRKRMSADQLKAMQEKISQANAEPRKMTIEKIDKPYFDTDFFKNRWVVHFVETDGLIIRPTDKTFKHHAEAQEFYEQTKAQMDVRNGGG